MSDAPHPRRRTAAELDAVFGDVLPSQTSDDTDDRTADGPGERDAADADRLLREVPPHHGS